MNTRTHISRKHGAMQINLDNWTFWFKGSWCPINNKTIEYWIGNKSPLTARDKAWFTSVI